MNIGKEILSDVGTFQEMLAGFLESIISNGYVSLIAGLLTIILIIAYVYRNYKGVNSDPLNTKKFGEVVLWSFVIVQGALVSLSAMVSPDLLTRIPQYRQLMFLAGVIVVTMAMQFIRDLLFGENAPVFL